MYYDMPMQVRYQLNGETRRGIVFHEWIVDMRTGQGFPIQDIERAAKIIGLDIDDAIIEQCEWRAL